MVRGVVRHLALAGTGVLAVVLAADCFTPTQLVVEITTDLPCPPAERGVLAVGRDDLLAGGKPTREVATSSCAEPRADLGDGLRGLGSLALVPSDDGERFTLRVAISRTAGGSAGCLDGTTDRKDCVVAQRSSRFVSNQKLRLPIFLSSACLGIECPPDAKGNPQTCERGQCVSALIDPCTGPACVPPTPPVDAAVSDADPGDAQEDVVTVDASTDANSLGACEWAGGLTVSVSPPTGVNRLVATTWGLFWKDANREGLYRMTLPPAAQVETPVETSVVEATASDTAAYYSTGTQVVAAFPDGGKSEAFPVGGGAGVSVPTLLAASNIAAHGIAPNGGAFAFRALEMTVGDVKAWPDLPINPLGARYGKELLVWSGKQIGRTDANGYEIVFDVSGATPAVDIVDVAPGDRLTYRALVALSNGQIIGVPEIAGNPIPLATAPGPIHEIAADAVAFYVIVSQPPNISRVLARRFAESVAPYPISSTTRVAARGLASLGSCVYFFEGSKLLSVPRPSGGTVILP